MYGKITKTLINKTIAEIKKTKKDKTLSDGGRLTLRLSSANIGKGSWSLRYDKHGQTIRVTLGVYIHGVEQSMQPEEARIKAYEYKKLLLTNDSGTPVSLRKPNITIGDLWDKYFSLKAPTWRLNSLKANKKMYKQMQKLGIDKLQVGELRIAKLRNLYSDYFNKSPKGCELMHSLLLSIVNFSVDQQVLDVRPSVPPFTSIFLKVPKTKPRQMLPFEEIKNFIEQLITLAKAKRSNRKYTALLVCILCLPLRVNELLSYEHGNIDDEGFWFFSADKMKNKQPHVMFVVEPLRKIIPLAAQCSQISLSSFKKKITIQFDSHGFRSLFASTLLNKYPEQNVLISDCLSHQSASFAAASDRAYFRHDLKEKKKEILKEWFNILEEQAPINELIEYLNKS